MSGPEVRSVTDTSPDQSNDTEVVANLEQDEVAAARALLKARAGAKGRRGGKAGGQGQVNGDFQQEGSLWTSLHASAPICFASQHKWFRNGFGIV